MFPKRVVILIIPTRLFDNDSGLFFVINLEEIKQGLNLKNDKKFC